MKKWIVFILLLITTTGTFIPCCGVDGCCADQITTATNQEDHKPEGTCSPFFASDTCPCSVELSRAFQMIEPTVEKQVRPKTIVIFNLTTYTTSFWQPPRSANFNI